MGKRVQEKKASGLVFDELVRGRIRREEGEFSSHGRSNPTHEPVNSVSKIGIQRKEFRTQRAEIYTFPLGVEVPSLLFSFLLRKVCVRMGAERSRWGCGGKPSGREKVRALFFFFTCLFKRNRFCHRQCHGTIRVTFFIPTHLHIMSFSSFFLIINFRE